MESVAEEQNSKKVQKQEENFTYLILKTGLTI